MHQAASTVTSGLGSSLSSSISCVFVFRHTALKYNFPQFEHAVYLNLHDLFSCVLPFHNTGKCHVFDSCFFLLPFPESFPVPVPLPLELLLLCFCVFPLLHTFAKCPCLPQVLHVSFPVPTLTAFMSLASHYGVLLETDHQTTGPPDHRTTRPPDPQTTGPPDHKTLGPPTTGHWATGPPDHGTTRPPDHRTLSIAAPCKRKFGRGFRRRAPTLKLHILIDLRRHMKT